MADEKTFKPKQPPTTFSATALDNTIKELYVKVFGKQPPLGVSIADWKRYVESSGRWDGAEAGGLRDTFNADMYFLDQVKDHLDNVDARTRIQYEELSSDIAALRSQITQTPFPMP
jgi:hypothetical protein